MSTIIRTRLIKIGNEQGIIIPQSLLDQFDLGQEVELELQEEQIIIRNIHSVHYDWEDRFQVIAERGEEQLLTTEMQAWDILSDEALIDFEMRLD